MLRQCPLLWHNLRNWWLSPICHQKHKITGPKQASGPLHWTIHRARAHWRDSLPSGPGCQQATSTVRSSWSLSCQPPPMLPKQWTELQSTTAGNQRWRTLWSPSYQEALCHLGRNAVLGQVGWIRWVGKPLAYHQPTGLHEAGSGNIPKTKPDR